MEIKFWNINFDILAWVEFSGNYGIKMPYKKLLPKIAAGRCKVVYMQPSLARYRKIAWAASLVFLEMDHYLLIGAVSRGSNPFSRSLNDASI